MAISTPDPRLVSGGFWHSVLTAYHKVLGEAWWRQILSEQTNAATHPKECRTQRGQSFGILPVPYHHKTGTHSRGLSWTTGNQTP